MKAHHCSPAGLRLFQLISFRAALCFLFASAAPAEAPHQAGIKLP